MMAYQQCDPEKYISNIYHDIGYKITMSLRVTYVMKLFD